MVCIFHESLGCRALPAPASRAQPSSVVCERLPHPTLPFHDLVLPSSPPPPPPQPQQPEPDCLSRKPKWKQQTHHRLPAGHTEGSFLTPAGDVGRIFLQLLQELPDGLAVVGNLAFLQERFELGGGKGEEE